MIDGKTDIAMEYDYFFVGGVRRFLFTKDNEAADEVERSIELDHAGAAVEREEHRHQRKPRITLRPCLSGFSFAI